MHDLIPKAQQAYDAANGLRVEPSIPILFFGDYEAFRKSKLRIVTVALNPGTLAFPVEKRWEFFPAYEKTADLQEAWNQYFRTGRPIEPWMTSLDCVLHGFDASLYDSKFTNTALHTDMLSPVATQTLWSQLDKQYQDELASVGLPLWHDLIRHLKPHIVVLSVATKHLKKIRFKVVEYWKTVTSFSNMKSGQPRKTRYDVDHSVLQICPDHYADFLFGRATRMPFSLLSNPDKKQIGEGLKGRLHSW
jgi:hypothetical protein